MTILKIRTVVASIGLVALVGCAPEPPIIAQTDDIDRFAQRLLNGLQPISIAESREYCGYIFETDAGKLAATKPKPGREDFCDLAPPDDKVLASYHTHGSFSDVYDNEVPSLDDMRGDFDARIDGYISTPGGRLWLIDHETGSARQLCDGICMASDPQDDPAVAGYVPQSFTLEQLKARFE